MDLETINERREEQGEAEMTEEDYNKFKAEDFDIANM
jgi:adenine-specific DNA methylase